MRRNILMVALNLFGMAKLQKWLNENKNYGGVEDITERG
nr:MAG TPA: hypothetical protein [Bacteriophage sp.]